MALQSFDYCALHYLNQWLLRDELFINGLRAGTRASKLETLQRAASFYRVARNLRTKQTVPKESKEKARELRYGPVLDLLAAVKRSQFERGTALAIQKFAKDIEALYKKGSLVSFATKMLWLKLKHPIIIFDKNARVALKLGSNDDLFAYYEIWRDTYSAQYTPIRKACERLSNQQPYAIAVKTGNGTIRTVTKSRVNELQRAEWFRERVFDMYLWNKGS